MGFVRSNRSTRIIYIYIYRATVHVYDAICLRDVRIEISTVEILRIMISGYNVVKRCNCGLLVRVDYDRAKSPCAYQTSTTRCNSYISSCGSSFYTHDYRKKEISNWVFPMRVCTSQWCCKMAQKKKTQKIKERDIYPTTETWLIVYIFFPIYDCSSSFIILIVSLSRIYLFHYLPSLCSCRWLVSFFSAFSIVYACN